MEQKKQLITQKKGFFLRIGGIILVILKRVFIRHKSCCKALGFAALLSLSGIASQAQNVISLNAIIDSTLKYSPALKGSDASVSQQKNLLKASFNLPNPEFLIQNPTGNFYTPGVQQNFDFPTVYSSQRKLQKENILLAEAAYGLNALDVKYQVSIVYRELQYQQMLLKILRKQDSIYRQLSDNSARQFAAGEIDFVQTGFAKTQSGIVHSRLIIAEAAYNGALQRLKIMSGLSLANKINVEALRLDSTFLIILPDTSLANNLSLNYSSQQIAVASKQLAVNRQRAMPGFTVAFLNQGEMDTPFRNRFYAGIRIPLWYWQYNGNTAAARNHVDAAKYEFQANQLQIHANIQEAHEKFIAYSDALFGYNNEVLKDADALVNAAGRFFNSGNNSYMDYLRNLASATEVTLSYWEIVKNYNQTLIYIQYLNGKL